MPLSLERSNHLGRDVNLIQRTNDVDDKSFDVDGLKHTLVVLHKELVQVNPTKALEHYILNDVGCMRQRIFTHSVGVTDSVGIRNLVSKEHHRNNGRRVLDVTSIAVRHFVADFLADNLVIHEDNSLTPKLGNLVAAFRYAIAVRGGIP